MKGQIYITMYNDIYKFLLLLPPTIS